MARFGHHAGGPAEGVRRRVEQLGRGELRVPCPADEQHAPVQEHGGWGAVKVLRVLHRTSRRPAARQRRRPVEQQAGCDGAGRQETQRHQCQERPSQYRPIRHSPGRSEPPAIAGERGLMGDRGGVERPRRDGRPSAETFLESRFEVEPLSHHGAPFGDGRGDGQAGFGSPTASARSPGRARSSRNPRRSAGPAAPGRQGRAEPAHWRDRCLRPAQPDRRQGRGVGHGKLDDGPAPSTADEQASLVGRDGYEPGAEPAGVAQATELPPDDRPGRLDCLIGDVEVAADHETDPGHVVVVGLDDPREGSFVAGGSERHRPDELVLRLDRHRGHTPQMLGGGSSDSYPRQRRARNEVTPPACPPVGSARKPHPACTGSAHRRPMIEIVQATRRHQRRHLDRSSFPCAGCSPSSSPPSPPSSAASSASSSASRRTSARPAAPSSGTPASRSSGSSSRSCSSSCSSACCASAFGGRRRGWGGPGWGHGYGPNGYGPMSNPDDPRRQWIADAHRQPPRGGGPRRRHARRPTPPTAPPSGG